MQAVAYAEGRGPGHLTEIREVNPFSVVASRFSDWQVASVQVNTVDPLKAIHSPLRTTKQRSNVWGEFHATHLTILAINWDDQRCRCQDSCPVQWVSSNVGLLNDPNQSSG
jgi:hypothetical protein